MTSVLDGYHACVFAYGQTASGKTFTMDGGPGDAAGVVPRTVAALFGRADSLGSTRSVEIHVSMLEVYTEALRDLLAPPGAEQRLALRGGGEAGARVEGAQAVRCGAAADALALLQRGRAQRSVGATQANAESSRSHLAVCFAVRSRSLLGDGQSADSRLWLVDLAGSERLSKSGAEGQRLKEARGG